MPDIPATNRVTEAFAGGGVAGNSGCNRQTAAGRSRPRSATSSTWPSARRQPDCELDTLARAARWAGAGPLAGEAEDGTSRRPARRVAPACVPTLSAGSTTSLGDPLRANDSAPAPCEVDRTYSDFRPVACDVRPVLIGRSRRTVTGETTQCRHSPDRPLAQVRYRGAVPSADPRPPPAPAGARPRRPPGGPAEAMPDDRREPAGPSRTRPRAPS
jgi:hypothetical protein